MFLNTAAIAKDVCNRWIGLIKAMKPALDDVVTINGCHISVLNQEQSKLQVITLPEDTMITASIEYRSLYDSINGIKVGEGIAAEMYYPAPCFFWMGPTHYHSLDILNNYYGEKITKSGLNHRFIKIKEMVEELKTQKKRGHEE